MVRTLVVAAFLSLPVSATATAIVETTGELSQTVDVSGGGSFSEVDLAPFNQALGTLTSASISISAVVSATVTDYTSLVSPSFTTPASVSLSFLSFTPIAFATQTMQVNTNGTTASARSTFSGDFTPASLASFTEPGDNFFIPEASVFIQGLQGPGTEDSTTVKFDITETLTYNPVPESRTLVLFATSAVVLGALVMSARSRSPG